VPSPTGRLLKLF